MCSWDARVYPGVSNSSARDDPFCRHMRMYMPQENSLAAVMKVAYMQID